MKKTALHDSDKGIWMRILIPSLCSLALFIGAFVFVLLPQFEASLLEQKKHSTRNMTQIAWGVVNDYYQQAEEGRISPAHARELAAEALRGMRYGPENKDYFWISTVDNHMVMHPYRADLEGQQLDEFEDSGGKRLFVEFVKATRKTGGAYVDYRWQWKDDADRIVPKLSYVKRFAPWGWIVGTGVYLEDIEEQAAQQTTGMVAVSSVIGFVILLLTAYSAYQALRADRIIRAEGQKYSALFEAANDGIMLLDEAVMISTNEKMAHMLGLQSTDELQERTIWSFSPNEQEDGSASRHAFENRLQKAAQEGPQRFVWRFTRSDGTYMVCEISLATVSIGEDTFVQAILRDITEQLEAQRKLRLSEEKFRATFDQTLQLMGLLDLEGRVIDVNKAALDFAQTTREEIRGRFFWETRWWVQTSEEKQRLAQAVRKASGGQTIRFRTVHVKNPEGELRHIDFSLKPVFDDQGKVQFLIPEGRDITEVIQTQSELRTTQEYTRSLIDSMPSIVVGVDSQCRVTHWNTGAVLNTGLSAEEAEGHEVAEVLPAVECIREQIHHAIQAAEPHEELRVPRAHAGSTIYEDIFVSPLTGGDSPGAVVRVDNVTQRVQLEEMMVQTEKMISVGGLAAGMAHEINNPLGIILQCVQGMERRLSPSLPANQTAAQELGLDLNAMRQYMERRDVNSYLSGIREAGRRAGEIVSNMLNFSRKSESQRTLQDMGDLLDRTLELAGNDYDLKKKYDFRQLRISRDYEPGLPQVHVTETEIEQVLLNILKNAAQAMSEKQYPRGEEPSLHLAVRRRARMVEIRIRDNGPGMAPEERKRVFEPFYTTKKPGVGTGLGLSVSYFIVVESHGGEFFVESTPGKGAEFVIRLPVYVEPPVSAA